MCIFPISRSENLTLDLLLRSNLYFPVGDLWKRLQKTNLITSGIIIKDMILDEAKHKPFCIPVFIKQD